MKKIIFLFVFSLKFIFFPTHGDCQVVNQCNDDIKMILELNDDLKNLRQHQIICRSGKVFINWTLKDQESDCLYLIEKSENGNSFRSIGVKMITSSDLEVFYSFVDENVNKNNNIYRLRKMNNNILVNE